MKLEGLDINTVSRAVAVYLDLAYGGGARPGPTPDLSVPPGTGWQEVLALFHKEEIDEGEQKSVRYAFRLGNRNYPFMKLVLQEHLVPGEFIFAVDTHDEMEIRPDYPDYDAWMAVRRFNQGLKRKIEAQLAVEGLHTTATLWEIAAARSVGEESGKCILVVDDEENIAKTLEALLRSRGYSVVRASDGKTALRLAVEVLPDLILLDYELPEMDGLEVTEALRSDEATAEIPVLLATAGHIGIEDVQKADGFLAKPFQEDLLYQMVERLLSVRRS